MQNISEMLETFNFLIINMQNMRTLGSMGTPLKVVEFWRNLKNDLKSKTYDGSIKYLFTHLQRR